MTSKKDEGVRKSGCPDCGGNDLQALTNTRQCLTCGAQIDGSGALVTAGRVDNVERVLGTTPAQPLPEAALIEQEGAPDLDRVRGTTPPQPLPVDAYNEPRVLGDTPPQPLPADAGQPAPTPVYADSTGAVSDTPPETHGDSVKPEKDAKEAALLRPKLAAKVADGDLSADEAQDKMPAGDGSVGDQPKTKDSYSVTSGFPSGETKIVTPGKKAVKPKIAKD